MASKSLKINKGFTLLELLIVVAIIGILASLLLPVLGKARKQSRLAVCLNNHRQMGIATVMFQDDNDSYFPDYSKGFDDLLSPYDGRNLSDAEIAQSPLPSQYQDSIYYCIENKGLSETRAVRSYGLNSGTGFGEDGGGLAWTGIGDGTQDWHREMGSRRVSDVVHSSRTFAFAERDMPNEGADSGNLMGHGSNGLSPLGEYSNNDPYNYTLVNYSVHGDLKLTFSMVDGSATLLRWLQFKQRGYWRHDESY